MRPPPEPRSDEATQSNARHHTAEDDREPEEVRRRRDLQRHRARGGAGGDTRRTARKIRRERAPAAKASAGRGRASALQERGIAGDPAACARGAAGQRAAQSDRNLARGCPLAAPARRRAGRTGKRSVHQGGAEDFRVTRFRQRTRTLTIFAVDASGSSALHRLAEAKGAVELLLAECYIRRDQVAVIAFRGRAAELLLPPTRSLVSAKRSLAALPGGGGTPLASAIISAMALAHQAQRRGETPTLVILTDGRANIGRGGAPGRESAQEDALHAARAVTLSRIGALFIDTSPRPNPFAQRLAATMRAKYIPLPYANAHSLSAIVAGTRT